MPAHPHRRPGLRRDALLPIDRGQARPPALRRPDRTHQRQRLDPGNDLNSHSSRGIFISYRREDDAKSLYPRLLKERLQRRLENVDVFVDRDDIPPGDDFTEVIIDKLHSSAVLIALIGPEWATAVDERGFKRIDAPGDYVRLEIQTA